MERTNPFSPRVIAGIILGGAIAFLGFLFLVAYAPQLKMRGGEGPTPMSRSAVGFYGLYKLAESTGRPVDLGSNREHWSYTGFTIVTILPDTDLETLRDLVATRRAVENSRTLYIMPKWITIPQFDRPKWVQKRGTLDPQWSKPLIEVFGRIIFGEAPGGVTGRIRSVPGSEVGNVDLPLPVDAHYIVSGMKPVLADTSGRTILGRTDFKNGAADYVLADPDILSNMGLKTPEGARAALEIVDAMRFGHDDSVAFDLVLNGGANSRNLLQLMFEPPFLALTLAVLAAALLVGIHAFNRFGPAVPEPRAIPFGKRALADNAATLMARAGAARRMGDRYVTMVRDAVATALGAGAMDPAAQEGWLARLPANGPDFATLAAQARAAKTSEAVRAAAAALYQWRNEVTRDR